jgi:putative MATE family efflux protein
LSVSVANALRWVYEPRHVPPDTDMRQVRKDILALSWPALLEQVLVSLCSMVDTMMVGQLGPYAIAAVGLCNQPKFILLATFIALNVGSTALVARMKGQGDQEGANRVLRQSMLMTFFLSAILAVVGALFAQPLVAFMGANEDTLGPATTYLQIQMYGFIFNAMSLAITAALRGAGNTRASMYLNLVANVVNVILNYCLIYGHFGFPRMEVAGASLATVIGFVVSCAMAIIILLRGRQFVRLKRGDSFKPHLGTMKRIVRIGLPAAFEQLAMRVGLLIYTKTVSGLGTVAFATHQVALSILNLSFAAGMAFSTASTTLVGQSLGREQPEMAKTYAAQVQRIGMLVALALGLVFLFFGEQLCMLYTDDPQVIHTGGMLLSIVALLQPFQCSTFIYAGGLRGAGDAKWPAYSVIIGIIIIRPLCSLLTVNVLQWGLVGAWVALVVDQLLRLGILGFRFHRGDWVNIKV